MAGAGSAAEVPMLGGRRDERAVMDGLPDDARTGRSGVLVLRGEAGIGKTALLEYASESASDFRLFRAVGVESEMELAFAALHQLCAPVDDFVDRLPAPQREALEITFGVSAGAAPDRFLVAVATLSLFSEAAQDRPLLGVVRVEPGGGPRVLDAVHYCSEFVEPNRRAVSVRDDHRLELVGVH